MREFEIKGSYEEIPPGNYQADFVALTEIETKNGKAFRWEFKVALGDYQGKTLSELSDSEAPPTTKNKTGKFLCYLANAPLEKGTRVTPDSYIGQRYFVIVSPKEGGKTKIETFSKM